MEGTVGMANFVLQQGIMDIVVLRNTGNCSLKCE